MRIHFTDSIRKKVVDDFVQGVNKQFERLNYGYRIVQGRIVDMASESEAMLMLVTCSATINYVRGKLETTKNGNNYDR